jgi:hypothetical protein
MKWTHSKLYANIYDQDGRHVAAITDRPEREDNARLIAAAPNLLYLSEIRVALHDFYQKLGVGRDWREIASEHPLAVDFQGQAQAAGLSTGAYLLQLEREAIGRVKGEE